MAEKQLFIKLENGLHSTNAILFCQRANEFKSTITLSYSYKSANAKSLMSILSLDIEEDAQITLSAGGEDSEAAVSALAAFLEGAE